MRRTTRLLAATVTVLLSANAFGDPVAAAETDTSVRLDRAIEGRLAELGVPGAIVSLSIPGELDYVRAFGVGDTAVGIPMGADFHTRIGSVTKTFTGTAVLQLVDRGFIRLSDPISRYVDGVPRGDEITLDLLGRMRSGLPDYAEQATFLDRLYREAPQSPTAFGFTSRQLIDSAFAQPMKFVPGAEWEYCNTNTVLLGMVVEKVTGMPLGEYLQQNVFGPLGLAQTSYPPDGWLPGPYAHGYNAAPDGTVYDTTLWNPSWANAAGQVVSTVSDLRTWAAAVGKGSLLQPQTQAHRVANGSTVVDGVDYDFAIFDVHGWLGHNGDIPGYSTVAVYLPERDASMVVAVNSDIAQPQAGDQLANVITSVVTPDHVYALGPEPPVMLDDS